MRKRWIIVLLFSVLLSKPASAEKSCDYAGQSYSHGSVKCQSGEEYKCNDGSWQALGTKCTASPHSYEKVIEELTNKKQLTIPREAITPRMKEMAKGSSGETIAAEKAPKASPAFGLECLGCDKGFHCVFCVIGVQVKECRNGEPYIDCID